MVPRWSSVGGLLVGPVLVLWAGPALAASPPPRTSLTLPATSQVSDTATATLPPFAGLATDVSIPAPSVVPAVLPPVIAPPPARLTPTTLDGLLWQVCDCTRRTLPQLLGAGDG